MAWDTHINICNLKKHRYKSLMALVLPKLLILKYWPLVFKDWSRNNFLLDASSEVKNKQSTINRRMNTKKTEKTKDQKIPWKMESCVPGLTSWNFVFLFFPFIGKVYPPVCSTVPTLLQALCHRRRDCNKG